MSENMTSERVCVDVCVNLYVCIGGERMIERETEGSFVGRKKNRRLSLKKKKNKKKST